MTKRIIGTLAIFVSLFIGQSERAQADSTVQTFIQIGIPNACTISNTSVNFANVNVITASASTLVTANMVVCNLSTVATVALGPSAHAGFCTGTTRCMKSGVNYLNYDFYTDSGCLNVWNAVNTLTVTGNGLGTLQSPSSIYACFPAPQTAPAGSGYQDVLTVTITF